ncbi:MAG: hypothetical protein RJA22_867 [Verrucomicrobiota bacterium]|jgi:uncharacterized protein Yka (UPF0111/DUF47 family)
MFSLQKLLGKDDNFFNLLEASAEEARHSVQVLNRVLSHADQSLSLEELHKAKEADKKITEQINEALVATFVSQLEREDIEVLSAALYKIPKTVEKIAERFIISAPLVQQVDFSRHITLLDAATRHVVELVKLLRELGAGRLDRAKEINARLQKVEGEADELILEILKDLYSGRHDATKVMAMKDLYELLEKVIDRCRDTGNIVTHIVLKNS